MSFFHEGVFITKNYILNDDPERIATRLKPVSNILPVS